MFTDLTTVPLLFAVSGQVPDQERENLVRRDDGAVFVHRRDPVAVPVEGEAHADARAVPATQKVDQGPHVLPNRLRVETAKVRIDLRVKFADLTPRLAQARGEQTLPRAVHHIQHHPDPAPPDPRDIHKLLQTVEPGLPGIEETDCGLRIADCGIARGSWLFCPNSRLTARGSLPVNFCPLPSALWFLPALLGPDPFDLFFDAAGKRDGRGSAEGGLELDPAVQRRIVAGRDHHGPRRAEANHRIREGRSRRKLLRQAHPDPFRHHRLGRRLGEFSRKEPRVIPHQHVWRTVARRFSADPSGDRPRREPHVREGHVLRDDPAPPIRSEPDIRH